jgi:hypothetical protein
MEPDELEKKGLAETQQEKPKATQVEAEALCAKAENKREQAENKRVEADTQRQAAATRQTQESEQKEIRAGKELRAKVDEFRRRYNRGNKIWRSWSLLFLHLFITLIAAEIFVWQSTSLHDYKYRADIELGLIILAASTAILLLEYMRNRRKYRCTLSRIDKLVVDVSNPEANLNAIRDGLKVIIDKHNREFLGEK